MRYLLLIFLLFSSFVFATEESQLAQLKNINTEITQLKQESTSFSGSELAVIRVQQIEKNDELRTIIANLIKTGSPTAEPQLVTEVNRQVQHTEQSYVYLENEIKKTQKQIDDASIEQKLVLQNTLNELKRYYYHYIDNQLQNYQWLTTLEKPDDKGFNAFRLEIEQKIKFLSASLNFDTHRESLLSEQLLTSSESEKPALTLESLFYKRKVSDSVYGLKKLISIADDIDISTTEYKHQVFSTTGNLTEDLLSFPVIRSIISSGFSIGSAWLLQNAPDQLLKLFIFIFILFIARLIANITRKMVQKAVVQPHLNMSKLMQDFFVSISSKAIFFIGILIAFSKIGLDLTPVLTGFGVAGIIIGFALQDTLSNFASGMMLLIYKPFDVNDFVEAGGVSGKVSHMSLVNTTIKTFDNQIIILPNSKIWGDVIKNVTHERVRRVDMVFGIGYEDNIEHAELVLNDIVENHPAVLKKPDPMIKVHLLNASSVDFIVRPWVKTDDYWDVYWDITREVKIRFDKEGISIPFAQQDVHVHFTKKEKKQKSHSENTNDNTDESSA